MLDQPFYPHPRIKYGASSDLSLRGRGDLVNMHQKTIFAIKFFHSIIFFLMVACLGYILYCATVGRYDWTLLLALIAIFVEGLTLLLNRWRCPLTSLAERYGAANGAVTDIFLPGWLTRHTFKIATIFVTIEVILLAWGYFTK